MTALRLPLLALCLFLCTCVSAQKVWLDATYTLKNGKTVSGQIPDLYDGRNLTVVSFRQHETAPEVLLPVESLSAFSTTANRYLVRDIEINTSPRTVKKLVLEMNKTITKTTGAMLLLLETSSFALYEYVDTREQNHYFLSSRGGEPEYLPYARYIRQNESGGTRVHNFDAYKVSLNQRLSTAPELFPAIQKMNYQRQDFMDLLTDYTEASGETIEYTQPKPRTVFRFAVLAGGGVADNKYFSSSVNRPQELTWKNDFNPAYQIGGAVSTITNANHPIRFSLELLYVSSSGSSSQELPDDPRGRAESRDRNVTESSFQAGITARYRILSAKVPLYLEAGVMGARIIKFEETASWTREFGVVSQDSETTRGTGRGYFGGISTDLGPIELSFRYGNTRIPTNIGSLFTDRAMLLVRYGLN